MRGLKRRVERWGRRRTEVASHERFEEKGAEVEKKEGGGRLSREV